MHISIFRDGQGWVLALTFRRHFVRLSTRGPHVRGYSW